uniref:Uncharacterized protein n=1 Tax=Sphaerodactylus townsendi TaxID=933632 RepID=A0ACB8F154_9SAUR
MSSEDNTSQAPMSLRKQRARSSRMWSLELPVCLCCNNQRVRVQSLDKLEEKLPICSSRLKVVASTKEVVSSTVNGAKNAVASSVSGVMDMTRSVVSGSVNTVMESRVGQMVATGMDAVLDMSEDLMNQYLPVSEKELFELAASVDCSDLAAPVEQPSERESCFVRLGSLSSKIRHRAYQQALHKLWNVKKGTEVSLTQLHLMIELVEHIKEGVGQKLQGGQEKLNQMWLEWSKKQAGSEEPVDSSVQPEVESQTLAMFRGVTQQLQGSYSALISSVQGLPAGIQDKVQHFRHTVEDLHSSFSTAHSFQDVSAAILAQSREQVTKAREAVDDVLDYVVSHVPLPWVVGPFAPSLVELPDAPTSKVEDDVQASKEPKGKLGSPPKAPSEPKKDI